MLFWGCYFIYTLNKYVNQFAYKMGMLIVN